MRVLHFADSHFSSKRLDECVRNFEYMVDYAIKNDVELAVCAGDLFDKNTMINSKEYLEAVRLISKLSEYMPVYIVRGNHDPEGALDVFKELQGSKYNIFVFDEIDNDLMISKNNWMLDTLFLPYINPFKFAVNSGSIKEIYDDASMYYRSKIKEFVNKESVYPKVVVGHFTVQGVIFGNSEKIISNEVMLNIDDFKGVDAVMLGHIHNNHQDLFDGKNICYSNSHYRINFGEKGDPGFVIWYIADKDHIKYEFIETPAREMYELYMSNEDVREFIENGIFDLDIIENSDIKLHIEIEDVLSNLFDKQALLAKFPDNCNVTISLKTISTENKKYEEYVKNDGLLDKFKIWAENNNIEVDERYISKLEKMESEVEV